MPPLIVSEQEKEGLTRCNKVLASEASLLAISQAEPERLKSVSSCQTVSLVDGIKSYLVRDRYF